MYKINISTITFQAPNSLFTVYPGKAYTAIATNKPTKIKQKNTKHLPLYNLQTKYFKSLSGFLNQENEVSGRLKEKLAFKMNFIIYLGVIR